MAKQADATGKTVYPIRAVDRVCDILDILGSSQAGAMLSEVAEQSDLPKSSAFRYLSALQTRGFVAQNHDNGKYRLGPAFRPQNTREWERLAEIAQTELDRLRDHLDETTNIGILDGHSVLHIAVSESRHMMRLAARVDERGNVNATALGKVLCSQLTDNEVLSILKHAGMPEITPSTITDPDEYLAELERVRTLGYGLDDEENQPAGRCVAVRIPQLKLPAALSISAPIDRLPMENIEMTVRQLKSSARRISERAK